MQRFFKDSLRFFIRGDDFTRQIIPDGLSPVGSFESQYSHRFFRVYFYYLIASMLDVGLHNNKARSEQIPSVSETSQRMRLVEDFIVNFLNADNSSFLSTLGVLQNKRVQSYRVGLGAKGGYLEL